MCFCNTQKSSVYKEPSPKANPETEIKKIIADTRNGRFDTILNELSDFSGSQKKYDGIKALLHYVERQTLINETLRLKNDEKFKDYVGPKWETVEKQLVKVEEQLVNPLTSYVKENPMKEKKKLYRGAKHAIDGTSALDIRAGTKVLKQGDIHQDKGFLSTTSSSVQYRDQLIRMEITSKEDSAAYEVEYDKFPSGLKNHREDEEEFLFPPNTKFELNKAPEETGKQVSIDVLSTETVPQYKLKYQEVD